MYHFVPLLPLEKELDLAGINNCSDEDNEELDSQLDVKINNVVCSFNVKRELNLREIAQNGFNVEYKRTSGMVTMRIRKPYVTASIWGSGQITCTGATSEEDAFIAAKRVARALNQVIKLVHAMSETSHPVRRIRFISNYRVVNVLGTCLMPFAIKIEPFTKSNSDKASYEPELHPGVTVRFEDLKATLKVFSTGNITVTAQSVLIIRSAVKRIHILVKDFARARNEGDMNAMRTTQDVKRNRNLNKFTEVTQAPRMPFSNDLVLPPNGIFRQKTL